MDASVRIQGSSAMCWAVSQGQTNKLAGPYHDACLASLLSWYLKVECPWLQVQGQWPVIEWHPRTGWVGNAHSFLTNNWKRKFGWKPGIVDTSLIRFASDCREWWHIVIRNGVRKISYLKLKNGNQKGKVGWDIHPQILRLWWAVVCQEHKQNLIKRQTVSIACITTCIHMQSRKRLFKPQLINYLHQ